MLTKKMKTKNIKNFFAKGRQGRDQNVQVFDVINSNHRTKKNAYYIIRFINSYVKIRNNKLFMAKILFDRMINIIH